MKTFSSVKSARTDLLSHRHRTFRWFALLVGLAAGLHHLPSAVAVLPEPDNVIFGLVTREGVPVTAADYDVVIEVRRAPAGPAIAQYTMGSNSRFGDHYSIRVKLESLTPITAADATQTNDRVYLVVTDYNGDLYSTNFVIGARGTFRQLDLGPRPAGDSDGDGLPDAWELARFGNLNLDGGSVGANGQSALANFLAGNNPNDPNDAFRLSITQNGPNKAASFFARQASGPGYEGLSRFYSLEYSTNVGQSAWFPVATQTNILGSNASIEYQIAEPFPQAIYRGRVQLRP